jgi:hypothetical protein
VVGFLLGRGTDARWVIIAGLLVMAAGDYWMSQLNLEISPGQVARRNRRRLRRSGPVVPHEQAGMH